MIWFWLVTIGLAFGSFVNALVWRIHEQSKNTKKSKKRDLSISRGRSMCVHCCHELSWRDLIPVLSWVYLRGRCRYCKRKISAQYPLVELVTAGLFVASYIFWPNTISGLEYIYFGGWLVTLTGLMALFVYDIRWMLLPNRIIFPLYGVVCAMVLVEALHQGSVEPLKDALYGILIGGGLFYVLFQVSQGRWIGGGDVKLGFLLGALIGGPTNALLLLFLASALATILVLPLLVTRKVSRSARIPFGPFLIAAAVIVMLFGTSMIDWYTGQFIDIY